MNTQIKKTKSVKRKKLVNKYVLPGPGTSSCGIGSEAPKRLKGSLSGGLIDIKPSACSPFTPTIEDLSSPTTPQNFLTLNSSAGGVEMPTNNKYPQILVRLSREEFDQLRADSEKSGHSSQRLLKHSYFKGSKLVFLFERKLAAELLGRVASISNSLKVLEAMIADKEELVEIEIEVLEQISDAIHEVKIITQSIRSTCGNA